MEPQIATTGLAHVWMQGDAVTRTVAIILALSGGAPCAPPAGSWVMHAPSIAIEEFR